jgi:hypothetical protein
MSKLDIDGLINQLINSHGKRVTIKEKDVSLLCKTSREVFMEQPVFLELEAPIKICGKCAHPDFKTIKRAHSNVCRRRARPIH